MTKNDKNDKNDKKDKNDNKFFPKRNCPKRISQQNLSKTIKNSITN